MDSIFALCTGSTIGVCIGLGLGVCKPVAEAFPAREGDDKRAAIDPRHCLAWSSPTMAGAYQMAGATVPEKVQGRLCRMEQRRERRYEH